MSKLKDVLRLKFEAKQSHQDIADTLGLSKGAVTKYVGLAIAAGLGGTSVRAMSEVQLESRIQPSHKRSTRYAQPDYGRIHQELRRKGMTLMLLWEEYCIQVGEDYSEVNPVQPWRYTQFCEYYRRFAKSLKRSMRQTHKAGERLFIDSAGPTIALVDGGTVSIFVAALGASSYCYAQATNAQTAADWLGADSQGAGVLWRRAPAHCSRQSACFGHAGQSVRATADGYGTGLCAALWLLSATRTGVSPARQSQGGDERATGRALDTGEATQAQL
jgi:hypothetical protein